MVKSDSLLGLHCFSGCDTISSFDRKGKPTFFKDLLNSELLVTFFTSLGNDWSVSTHLKDLCEKVTCYMYQHPKLSNINEARLLEFKESFKKGSIIPPPNRDTLLLKLDRANYQTKIWKSCLINFIETPDPTKHGWVCHNNTISIKWTNFTSLVPEELLQNLKCSCSKSECKTNLCTCKRNYAKCSIYCKCTNCHNIPICSSK